MVLKAASLIFNDSSSPFNKELIEFLRRNLESVILKCSIMFHFKIAKAAELKELKDMGITRLPAMTIGKDHYIGVPNIVSELRNRVKLNTDTAAMKTDDEILRDFQISALGDVKKNSDGQFVINDNDDDEDKDKNELMSAFNKEIARRTGNTAPNENKLKPTRPNQETSRPSQPSHQNNSNHSKQKNNRESREDNVDDAMQSLKNIRKSTSSDDAQDDNMMEALLARMGND